MEGVRRELVEEFREEKPGGVGTRREERHQHFLEGTAARVEIG